MYTVLDGYVVLTRVLCCPKPWGINLAKAQLRSWYSVGLLYIFTGRNGQSVLQGRQMVEFWNVGHVTRNASLPGRDSKAHLRISMVDTTCQATKISDLT
jgi:hypothetical protein